MLSLTGEQVGWITYVSRPRTFSPISQKVSPSLNRDTRASPSGVSSTFPISAANAGLALPVNKQNLLTATGFSGVFPAGPSDNLAKTQRLYQRDQLGAGQLAADPSAVNVCRTSHTNQAVSAPAAAG